MKIPYLPTQPHPFLSYLRVGSLLHWSLLLFILESYIYWVQLEKALTLNTTFGIVFWLGLFLFSFLHIFLVIMDGWSRFQDYKRAKDLFFIHGYNPRIAAMYRGSRCQRSAAIVAAEELGIEDNVRLYFTESGVKWYHYVPYFIVRDPFFLSRHSFWERTFLEKYYSSKFDYRKLQFESIT
ncbi:MAG: hypothetical protein ACR2MM_10820 [Flavobacteriaceae bacterium]